MKAIPGTPGLPEPYDWLEQPRQKGKDLRCVPTARPAHPLPREGHSKADRLKASFNALPETNLAVVADRLLQQETISTSERRAIEDVLWAEQGSVEISQRKMFNQRFPDASGPVPRIMCSTGENSPVCQHPP